MTTEELAQTLTAQALDRLDLPALRRALLDLIAAVDNEGHSADTASTCFICQALADIAEAAA